MSEDLEKIGSALFDNQVPTDWGAPKGFLSLKPLASWQQDLTDRTEFLATWVEKGSPVSFWISGFFFPQAFFTGAMQNYARKYEIAIDELSFEYKVYDEIEPQDVTEMPEDGVFCFGLYIEGARWNKTIHMVDESKPKVLYVEMPLIWYVPKKNREKPLTGIYHCPVYKVLSRTGTLSTTGHSTNFVLYLFLSMQKKHSTKHWVKRGVALLTGSSD